MNWYITFFPKVSPWHMMTASSLVDMLSKKLDGNIIGIIEPTDTPFISVGYHQDISREVNVELCNNLKIPVIRRETGGGTVIITKNQQGYRIAIKEKFSSIKELYSTYLQPVLQTIRDFGLPAELRGQDILVNKKKISGNGAVSLENSVVITGSVILRNDLTRYVDCLQISEEKFKDKIAKSMDEWITGIFDELHDTVNFRERLIQNFQKYWNPKEYKLQDEDFQAWNNFINELKKEQGDRHKLNDVNSCFKVSSKVFLCHIDKKFDKLIRVTVKIIDDEFSEVEISGDFFVIPREFITELEKALIGKKLTEYENVISSKFEENPKIYGFNKEQLLEVFSEIMSLRYKIS
ncbi:lipoate--protein ligase family protein [Acidianus manzaensis]|uniref:BPL/LPL catalytic domain-containing protein n=1 Tax=Acidianus manzaensis TaxID=282676 RepID=A0A1W6K2M0_9CREN|nr:biotin/lipoate A/B protein ligase family protein [Acidianus manzaensis]ARM76778.1 hypothetical protein B6F84_12635 [Acidianus manzaensis]